MNKSLSGNEQEVVYTKQLNRKDKFWNKIRYDKNTTYAIHIIYKKYGKVNEGKIQPKADIILVNGNVPNDYLSKNKYYLNENDIEKFDLTPINESGISVKLPNSKYTITKISPNTFIKIYGSNLLGAGASIYCKKEKDFDKNIDVLTGWNISEKGFYNYFNKNIKNLSLKNLSDKDKLTQIKTFSNQKIGELTLNSKKISDLIFKGIGNFEEPYTAHYIIENDEIKENYYIPYIITTGSGRSKGIFTIVFKPK